MVKIAIIVIRVIIIIRIVLIVIIVIIVLRIRTVILRAECQAQTSLSLCSSSYHRSFTCAWDLSREAQLILMHPYITRIFPHDIVVSIFFSIIPIKPFYKHTQLC